MFQRSLAKQRTPGPQNEHETLLEKHLVPTVQRLFDTELLKDGQETRLKAGFHML